MAQLVKLTDTLDDTIWVNPDAVMLVEPRYTTNGIKGTQITLQSGREIGVEEKMETVVEKIGEPTDVSVVRCRDCVYYKSEKLLQVEGSDFFTCPANGGLFGPDDYCSSGERSEI